MPDIFGRELHDYEHLRDLREASGDRMVRDYLRTQASESGFPAHDFQALNRSGSRSWHSRSEVNSQALGFFTNNLQAIDSTIQEILYTELRYPEFIPLVRDIPEGATSWADRVMDWAGEGAFIDQDGTSVPSATVAQRLETYPLALAGIAGKWTLEAVRNAMMTGVSLPSETVQAAARGAANHIERVGFSGWSPFGWTGFVNLPTSGANAVVHNEQSSSQTITSDLSAEAIRKLLDEEIVALIKDTQEVVGRTITDSLCFYFPLDQYFAITSDPIGDDANKSIWSYILRNNAWTRMTGNEPMIKSLQELSGAGVSGSDRMITTIMSERIFGLPIAIMPRVTSSGMEGGYMMCAYFEYKLGPLVVRRPTLIRYRDRI